MKQILYNIIILFPLLLTIGCKSNKIITEKISSLSDSSAVMILKDEISQKETQIVSLHNDLNRFKEENLNLRSEISIHEINYDTSQPINLETHKPPVSSEVFTISNTQLEKTINKYEVLLQRASIDYENLSTFNRRLESKIEIVENENKTIKSNNNLKTIIFLGLNIIAVVIFHFLNTRFHK